MQAFDLQKQLTRKELDSLSTFLGTTEDAMPFAKAHGVLTGVASAPTMLMPSVWQRRIVGKAKFESASQATSILGTIMRLYNQILQDLNQKEDVTSAFVAHPENEALWCRGYLEAVGMDEEWMDDERARKLLIPIAMLSGLFDLRGETDENGDVIIEDLSRQFELCREKLGTTTLVLHHRWIKWRLEQMQTKSVKRPRKVGRNELCLCGSGSKYKKCCALKIH